MQKIKTFMTLVVAPCVSSATGESANAPRRRPILLRWIAMITSVLRTAAASST